MYCFPLQPGIESLRPLSLRENVYLSTYSQPDVSQQTVGNCPEMSTQVSTSAGEHVTSSQAQWPDVRQGASKLLVARLVLVIH